MTGRYWIPEAFQLNYSYRYGCSLSFSSTPESSATAAAIAQLYASGAQ
jgi:hypothetical protein